jgi:hypothetical protein
MKEESQRIAILLHGPSCVGKTSVGRLLLNNNEPIELGPGPYDYLRSSENVIVLHLGCGEDYPLRADSHLGPTRNPEPWQQVIEEENRALFAFLLTADWPAIEARALAESSRGVTLGSACLSYQLYRNRHEVVTLPATAGILEDEIDTTHMNHNDVASVIRSHVAKTRPFQHWPSTLPDFQSNQGRRT